MYLSTSDFNFTVENTVSLCITFTYRVYFNLEFEFLIKCSLFQVQTRHFKDFELLTLTFDLENFVEKMETYFFEVLIQNWSRNTKSPTIYMSFPQTFFFLHKLPDYICTNRAGIIVSLAETSTCFLPVKMHPYLEPSKKSPGFNSILTGSIMSR